MSENIKLEFGDGSEFEATPDNTALFTFMGALACYDHVFIAMEEPENNRVQGSYVFISNKMFGPLVEHILEHDYPLHLNLRQVAECDEEAYARMIHKEADDLDAGVPEDWAI